MTHRQGRDLYLVRCSNTGLVKIGSSNNALHRFKALQTGSASPLEMVAALEGGGRCETFVHRFYAGRRIRGEWFDLTNVGDPVWRNLALPLGVADLYWWVADDWNGHNEPVVRQQWLNGNVPKMANHNAT